ncbi:hypothetical protein GGH91_002570, partial [Coemansia sp. RSA 2671]
MRDLGAIFSRRQSKRRNHQPSSPLAAHDGHAQSQTPTVSAGHDIGEVVEISEDVSDSEPKEDEQEATTSQTKVHGLKRSLSARHLSFISLGGTLGTGLFISAGTSLAMAGPGGALVSYAFLGGIVFFLMSSLGELAT